MLPAGALCFYQPHLGRTVLPKWPLWAHLFYSVFYSVSELRRASLFRQARVARAVLPPVDAMFRAGAFALPPCATAKSHMCPLPHLGLSEQVNRTLSKSVSPGVCVHTLGFGCGFWNRPWGTDSWFSWYVNPEGPTIKARIGILVEGFNGVSHNYRAVCLKISMGHRRLDVPVWN